MAQTITVAHSLLDQSHSKKPETEPGYRSPYPSVLSAGALPTYRDQNHPNPTFPTCASQPRTAHRNMVVIGVRADFEMYTVTNFVESVAELNLEGEEMPETIMQATNQMWQYVCSWDDAMLGILLEDILRRQRYEIIEEDVAEEQPADGEIDDSHATTQNNAPQMPQDGLAALLGMERELDALPLSDTESEGDSEEDHRTKLKTKLRA
ncbi:hypothetical protein AC579_3644 [Pseudocercospora musae]|uniref:Uncharacterized protein n=1 Tax=Pseudocercospora musae TaxID=113226 RepID=A0A139IT70_9PEZI|nr:hypothetical protein AC579_3644 [Pseudocercospora musae]